LIRSTSGQKKAIHIG
jgi:hypothetical protein